MGVTVKQSYGEDLMKSKTMKIQSTVTPQPTNELIELPKSEQLRVEILFKKTMGRAINMAIEKDTEEDTPADFNKSVTDIFSELIQSEYADLLFYNHKLEKDIEQLNK